MKPKIGLDVGITSVGWCLIDADKNRIEDLGVRKFDKAENPKTGSSLAAPRRMARSARRNKRRKALRIREIKNILINSGAISQKGMDILFAKTSLDESPWGLRSKGLKQKLTPSEWVRVLIHLSKRRGYLSNRKSENEEKSSDTGKVLIGVKHTSDLKAEKHYITIGQMFAEDNAFANQKRNRRGSYQNCFLRSEIKNEIKSLFNYQRKYENKFASSEIEDAFTKIWGRQRSFSDFETMNMLVGNCTFEKNEKRAPKNSYTAERFMLIQKINQLRVGKGWFKYSVSPEQRDMIIALAYKNKSVTFTQIKKEIGIPDDFRFNLVSYKRDQDLKESEKKRFLELKFYHGIRNNITKNLGINAWNSISENVNILDSIGYALTYFKDDSNIKKYLQEKNIDPNISESVLSLSFTKFCHLSFKALYKILPHLEAGSLYNEAVEKAGYTFSKGKQSGDLNELPSIEYDDIRNPVVYRAINQARQVLNDLIKKYGSPYIINIEIVREMSKNFTERSAIEKEQKENQEENERCLTELREEYGVELSNRSGLAILKNRLWHEQDGFCLYSKKPIDRRRLLEDGYCEIDHILPYSRSFDDSYANKALVLTKENHNKGNNTPYEYLGSDPTEWGKYKAWIKALNKLKPLKEEHLVIEEFSDEEAMQYRERYLNDTKYICRYLKNFIEDNLKFILDSQLKQRVYTIRGQLTATLRRHWGLSKKREESSLHHAQDAAVIAAVDRSTIMNLENYFKYRENRFQRNTEQSNEKTFLLEPWPGFRKELLARLSENPKEEIIKLNLENYDEDHLKNIHQVIPSYAVTRKITGKAHDDTIRSKKLLNQEGKTYVKKYLKDIKTKKEIVNLLNTLIEMRDIKSSLYQSDTLLYDALINELERAKNEGRTNIFNNGFRKPTKTGKEGPLVYGIKVLSPEGKSGFELRGGIVAKDSMARIDIFEKNDGRARFHIVPVYVKDFLNKTPPDRTISAHKPETNWKKIDTSYKFLCSLYQCDLFRIVDNDDHALIGFYKECDRSNGTITINAIENGKEIDKRISIISKAKSITRLFIDRLGIVHTIKWERRKWPGGISLSKTQPN